MRILIFHGYLLRGTGSNIYNASLAQTMKGLGHDVHVLCQDRRAAELPWVDAVGAWEDGRLTVERVGDSRSGASVTVYTPEIGGLLPVYVADRYEGFEVKTFPELSDAELDRYLDANVGAVKDIVERAGRPDIGLANHLIMGPAILRRAGLRFATKVHGSDLSYTVVPHAERFVPYARRGTDFSAAVLVGSRHTAEQLWGVVGDPELPARTRLGPPGVDVQRFRPRPAKEALAALDRLAAELDSQTADRSFGRDGPAAAAAVRHWARGSPRILYVGKLLANKGVGLLIEAWPRVLEEHPGARLLLAGFGEYRAEAEERIRALGEEGSSVAITGRLEHVEVAELDPAADALVMPSIFPEAFGMVAVEAAACGVLPISADHSGMREVSRQLAEAVEPAVAPLLSFPIDRAATPAGEREAAGALAARLSAWLGLPERDRERARAALARRAAELWSWERVAEDVISASEGRLDDLVEVPHQ